MPALILASVPMNSEAGSYMTFAAPVGCFVVVATILYLLFSRPHQRIPPRRPMTPSAAMASGPAAPPASAAGMPTASGGGSAESAAEQHGANRDALAAEDEGPGKVAGATEGSSEPGTTEGTEASE